MKKTFLAASVIGCAAGASAQSSVTLFGVLDTGVSYYNTTSEFYNNTNRVILPPALATEIGIHQTVLSNSNTLNSRLGFRGTEDLGGGLSASFWLESGLATDTGLGNGPGGTIIFNRRSTVSLSSSLGEVRLGRDFTPTFWNDSIFSPFSTIGVAANVISTIGTNLAVVKGPGSAVAASDNYLRTSNSIGYFLPANLGGFYGQLQYAFPENISQSNVPGTPSNKGQFYGGRAGYASGPLDVAVAYAVSDAANTTGLNPAGLPTFVNLDEKIKTLNVGASYNFQFVKIFGEFSQVKDQSRSTTPNPLLGLLVTRGSGKYTGGLLGATVPVGPGLIKAAYSTVKFDNASGSATPFAPKRDASVDKFGLGYEYNFSKRTAVYATAAYIRVKDGQNNPSIMGATAGTAPYISTGAGVSGYAPSKSTGYDFGIRHSF
ncbi:porin [Variovorax humicola]|uniref:Porin n=1 Tax=Variovorax humicola TaxID=1769758 RepID=A0ABU8WC93_9BURK